jgi:hypothetical protein
MTMVTFIFLLSSVNWHVLFQSRLVLKIFVAKGADSVLIVPNILKYAEKQDEDVMMSWQVLP